MRSFWTVVGRELASRRLLLVASVCFGLFVAITPWLAGSSRPEELRGVTGVVGMALWGLTLAAVLGATAVAGPLASRRLAFDFRLPIPATAIWLGRLLGGAIVLLTSVTLWFLIPLPFGLDLAGAAGALDYFVESALPGRQEIEGLLVLSPFLLLLVYLLAHTAAVAIAGARAWLALDLTAVLVAKLGVWLAWRELGLWFADEARLRLLTGSLLFAVAALVVVALVAGSRGRSEPDRVHRAQSLTLLPASLLLAALALGYGYWYSHPSADDLIDARWQSIDGRWSYTAGRAPMRGQTRFEMLRDEHAGTTVRLGPGIPGLLSSDLSADRSTFVWTRRIDPDSFRVALWSLSLADPSPQAKETPITWTTSPSSWALSPDGTELISIRGNAASEKLRLERESLRDGGLLGVVPLPVCRWEGRSVRYLAAERVAVVCIPRTESSSSDAPHRRYEVDLRSGAIEDRGAVRLTWYEELRGAVRLTRYEEQGFVAWETVRATPSRD